MEETKPTGAEDGGVTIEDVPEPDYRDLVEQSHDLLCTHDLQGRLLSVNLGAARALGYHPAELNGRSIGQGLLAPYRDRFESYLKEIAANGVARGLMAVQTRSGETRFWEYHNTLRTEGVGSPVVRGFAHDVTEQRRAEMALKASERKFRAIFESAMEAKIIMDAGGVITSANPATGQLLGISVEDLSGRNLSEFARDIIEFGTIWGMVISQGSLKGEFILRRPDAEFRHVEYAANDGLADGHYLVELRDVTERKSLQAQFRQSQKMEALGRLAGGIAHDFNNLLTAINGYSEIVLRRLGEQDPLREAVHEIKRAGERAAGLTRQLLVFSRKPIIEPRLLDLNSVVRDVNRMLRRLIHEDIHLVTELEPGLWSIKGDPSHIEQILVNLAVNAGHAMPQGGTLTIRTQNVELPTDVVPDGHEDRHVLLEMADTGIGMDPETLSRVFEPFFTTKEAGEGSGLGLSTVYGLVIQNGGSIRVQSALQQGSVFRIFLPALATAVGDPAAPLEFKVEAGTGETILLVEDEEMVRKLASEALRIHGYHVLEAEGPTEALAIAEKHRGQLKVLLTDVIMPQMSGKVLALTLTGLSPSLKVIYMSGYSGDLVLQQQLRKDCGFVQKPFGAETLIRAVREILRNTGKAS